MAAHHEELPELHEDGDINPEENVAQREDVPVVGGGNDEGQDNIAPIVSLADYLTGINMINDRGGFIPAAPFIITHSLGAFLGQDNIQRMEGVVKLFLMNIAIDSLINKVQFNPNSIVLYNNNEEHALVTEIFVEEAQPQLLRNMRAGYVNAMGWSLDLTAVNQIRVMSSANIKSYFAQFDQVRVDNSSAQRLVAYASGNLARLYSDPQIRTMLSDSRFMAMHRNYSSTPQLAVKCLQCIMGHTNSFFTNDTTTLFTDASNAPWDKALQNRITNIMILQVYVILETYNCLPANWFQGQRALADANPNTVSLRRAICRRFYQLTATNVEQIATRGITDLFIDAPPV